MSKPGTSSLFFYNFLLRNNSACCGEFVTQDCSSTLSVCIAVQSLSCESRARLLKLFIAIKDYRKPMTTWTWFVLVVQGTCRVKADLV